MKVPFDIKFRPQIESGEYKVETRDGKGVRIVCWDAKRTYNDCICGLIEEKEEHPYFWQLNGCWWADNTPSFYDLFIITPEPELSEFEKAVIDYKYGGHDSSLFDPGYFDKARNEASELFDLARKEFARQGSIVLSVEDFEKHYVEAQEKGRKEALKDLPRWRKCAETDRDISTVPPWIVRFDAEKNTESAIVHQGYFLVFSDLEKLPKEDEQ